MKVVIELPDNWLDSDLTGNIQWLTKTVREQVHSALVKAIVDQVEIPQIEVTAEELKPVVLSKMADVAIDKKWLDN